MAFIRRRAAAARRSRIASARRPAVAAFLLALLRLLAAQPAAPSALVAQSPLPLAAGHSAEALLVERGAPWRWLGLAVGTSETEFYFALGNALWRAQAGAPPQGIAFTPGGLDIGFVLRPRATGPLLYSEFASATLILRELTTGHETQRAIPANSFDAERTLDGIVLLAANPDWPAPGAASGIWALPAGSGAAREVVRLGGPSAPLLIDRESGDLFCARFTQGVPAPPGSVVVLRFARASLDAAIAGAPPLSVGAASLFASGLDGAYDLAQDDRGALWISDPVHGDVRRIARDGAVDATPLVPRRSQAALGLAFVDGGPARFAAWQRDDGGTLLVASSDFSSEASVHAVRAQPPRLRCAQGPTPPPGIVQIDAEQLPPASAALLLVSFLPPVPPRVLAWHDDVPLLCDLDFAIAPIGGALSVDAAGRARFAFQHQGGFALPLSFVVAALPATGAPAISRALALVLQP
ncbi:MAG: hypothetical protein IT457_24400 [Planctomycetes bacterium]|nr:hypothetical protein [Planctomycetota bacterium]